MKCNKVCKFTEIIHIFLPLSKFLKCGKSCSKNVPSLTIIIFNYCFFLNYL